MLELIKLFPVKVAEARHVARVPDGAGVAFLCSRVAVVRLVGEKLDVLVAVVVLQDLHVDDHVETRAGEREVFARQPREVGVERYGVVCLRVAGVGDDGRVGADDRDGLLVERRRRDRLRRVAADRAVHCRDGEAAVVHDLESTRSPSAPCAILNSFSECATALVIK